MLILKCKPKDSVEDHGEVAIVWDGNTEILDDLRSILGLKSLHALYSRPSIVDSRVRDAAFAVTEKNEGFIISTDDVLILSYGVENARYLSTLSYSAFRANYEIIVPLTPKEETIERNDDDLEADGEWSDDGGTDGMDPVDPEVLPEGDDVVGDPGPETSTP